MAAKDAAATVLFHLSVRLWTEPVWRAAEIIVNKERS